MYTDKQVQIMSELGDLLEENSYNIFANCWKILRLGSQFHYEHAKELYKFYSGEDEV